MIITQPDRVLLAKQVKKYAHHLVGNVLDVGGGSGTRYRSDLINATGYMCLDINEENKPDIVGSAEAIPVEDASVDSVLCTQVMEHLPHPQKAIAEVYRVLKPDGIALITAPQWNELHEEPHDYFRYTSFGLQTMCSDVGFSVLEIDQRGAYHSCLAQMRIRYLIDRWKPYDRKFVMYILGPISMFWTSYSLWRDRLAQTQSSKKHAIGWAMIVKK